MNRTEEYIEKFKELERVVRESFNLKKGQSISWALSEDYQFRGRKSQIQYCQEVRNFLQHEGKFQKEFVIQPSQAMITFIDQLIKDIQKRTKCSDAAVTGSDIYSRKMGDSVVETIKDMKAKGYTHVPILDGNVVQSVFDENSLFNYIADEGIIDLDDLKFNDLASYMSLTDRETVAFDFVPANSYLDDLTPKFQQALKEGKRLGMIFLTPAGKPHEQLTGILTPWDVLARLDI